jgi:hypothetical protein
MPVGCPWFSGWAAALAVDRQQVVSAVATLFQLQPAQCSAGPAAALAACTLRVRALRQTLVLGAKQLAACKSSFEKKKASAPAHVHDAVVSQLGTVLDSLCSADA